MSPLETVNEFIRRVCAKDLDGAAELVSDDVEYDNVPMGKNHGPEELVAFLSPMITTLDAVEFITHREAATGNIVMNERTDRFVKAGENYDVAVTGVFELNDDGKISLWRDYFDLAAATTVLGAMAEG
jgi:limonene-1,2-epoxide hydrolase